MDASLDAGPDEPMDSGVDAHVAEAECSNGIDDDLDGDADCADADCDPVVVCVPEPETDWSAPGVLNVGATAAPCDAAYDTEVYVGHSNPSGSPATCAACSCGAPTSSSCANHYVCERTSGCAGTCTASSISGSGCVESAGSSATFLPRNGTYASGSCAAGTSTATTSPPSWGEEARLCTASATAATGCAVGAICVPRPAAPSPTCVVRDGDVACPAGYGDREVFYEDFVDTRTCSACSCSFSASSCSVAVTAYDQPSCGGTATPLSLNTCFNGDPASYTITHTVNGASCSGIGTGSPLGAVSAAAPSTVCCTN